jgi:predicted AlkP superfamily phosphohydrolase/phosphomutase
LTKDQLAEESDKLISGLKEKLQTLEAQQKNEKITSGIERASIASQHRSATTNIIWIIF